MCFGTFALELGEDPMEKSIGIASACHFLTVCCAANLQNFPFLQLANDSNARRGNQIQAVQVDVVIVHEYVKQMHS